MVKNFDMWMDHAETNFLERRVEKMESADFPFLSWMLKFKKDRKNPKKPVLVQGDKHNPPKVEANNLCNIQLPIYYVYMYVL